MQPLNDNLLVTAEEPLINFLRELANPPYYRLVLQGVRVEGIVTRSDALKLPVRMLGFTLATNLELLMKDIIVKHIQDENVWLGLLSDRRQANVLVKKDTFAKAKMEPMLIELTDFCDKRTILLKYLQLPKQFKIDLETIEEVIRNPLAHAATYFSDDLGFEKFISTLELTQAWIDKLTGYLN